MGVVAIIILEVAAVIVLSPILKTIRYIPKPRAPDKKKRPICFILNGRRKLLNMPIINRIRLAREHLKNPKASGLKCIKANLEKGKEDARKITAVKANKYDFILLDITYLYLIWIFA